MHSYKLCEDGVGFEPTVVLQHWVNSPDFSTAKAIRPFKSDLARTEGFEPSTPDFGDQYSTN